MRSLFFLLICSCFSCNITSQTTIGSNLKPLAGTILDLKQYEPDAENSTSKKGLLLPRVNLTSPFTLDDIKDSDNNELLYKGLIIYNVSTITNKYNYKCDLINLYPSVYIWDGEQWLDLGKKGIPSKSNGITDDNIDFKGIDGNISWVLTKDGTLSICGEGDMKNYINTTSVPWSTHAELIKNLKISNTLTSIGKMHFMGVAI